MVLIKLGALLFNTSSGVKPCNTWTGPKAFINWLLLDEQLRPVPAGSGFDAVSSGGELKQHYRTIAAVKNGYLYIYCSNQSNQDVLFDNVQVIHHVGPMVEETHYYPFGNTLAGISSKAVGTLSNKYQYNGNELQSKEFSVGSGLELYDFNARTYDQQIGRFIQIDPLSDEEEQETLSPYHYTGNNPIRFNDPTGKCGWCKEVWKEVKSAAKETWAATKRGAVMAYDKSVSFAREFNRFNPIASMAEVVTGKSAYSDFTESKSRIESVPDLVVNSIGMFGGEIANLSTKLSLGVKTTSSVAASEDVLMGAAADFTRLETLGGNQSSRTVGANIKLINSGEELAPIKVALIDGKSYVLDGHHRLEAARRTGTSIRYEVVPEFGWKGYNYNSRSEILSAAADASAQSNKLNGKIVNQYAQ